MYEKENQKNGSNIYEAENRSSVIVKIIKGANHICFSSS